MAQVGRLNWSIGRQPPGAVLHSSREPSELSQWLWCLFVGWLLVSLFVNKAAWRKWILESDFHVVWTFIICALMPLLTYDRSRSTFKVKCGYMRKQFSNRLRYHNTFYSGCFLVTNCCNVSGYVHTTEQCRAVTMTMRECILFLLFLLYLLIISCFMYDVCHV